MTGFVVSKLIPISRLTFFDDFELMRKNLSYHVFLKLFLDTFILPFIIAAISFAYIHIKWRKTETERIHSENMSSTQE